MQIHIKFLFIPKKSVYFQNEIRHKTFYGFFIVKFETNAQKEKNFCKINKVFLISVIKIILFEIFMIKNRKF